MKKKKYVVPAIKGRKIIYPAIMTVSFIPMTDEPDTLNAKGIDGFEDDDSGEEGNIFDEE